MQNSFPFANVKGNSPTDITACKLGPSWFSLVTQFPDQWGKCWLFFNFSCFILEKYDFQSLIYKKKKKSLSCNGNLSGSWKRDSESFPDSLLSVSGMESPCFGFLVLEKRLSSDVDFQIISVWAINNRAYGQMQHCIFGLGWRCLGTRINSLIFPSSIEDWNK